jgi:ferredoxin
MTEPVYEKLVDALNSRGGAMPAIKCKELFAMVEELFTPEEAELAAKLPPSPIPAETFAREIAGDPKEVESLLENMANKGLVFTQERSGVRFYNLMALVVGILEMQFMGGEVSDRARKIAHLFEDYGNAFMQLAAAAPTPIPTGAAVSPPARVVTVEKEIPGGTEIHPYDKVSECIAKYDYISVGTCYCRHQGELLGRPCDKPKDVCMSFGPWARYIAERGFGKMVSKDEALQVLDRAEKAGLVHLTNNDAKHIDFICNCCTCHCGILGSIKNAAIPSMVATSSFIASLEEGDCSGCGDCVELCQMDALTMEDDIAVLDAERCIGCGVCVSVCPTGALRLELREGAPVPPL